MTTDESDSHAVAFGRKRDHHEVSNNNDEHLDSIILTPRKRTKVEEADYEGGKSPGLSADDAATMAAEPVSPGYNEDARDQAMSEEEQDGATYALRKDSGPAPSANWNTGSKAKIRTSLGRGTEKDSGAQPYSEPDGTEHDQLLDENVPHKMTGTSAQSLVTGSPTQIVERRFDPPAAEKAVINLSDPMGELGNARTLNISTAENASARPEPPPKTHPDVDLESGDDVIILNVQNSGQESGEISEGHVQGSDADGGSQYRSEGAGSNSDSESDDAMISYSQSAPPDKDLNNAESPSQQRFAQSLSPRTMADLAPEELKLQLKYFHPTKTLDDLDGNGVFKCLVCAQEGHLPEACDKLTCAVCGKYNEHSTRTCPQRTRCKRCREPGHESSSCHHKLAATRAEIICDWCQRVGHIEDDCELLWRTSGRPWETQFIIRTLGLGCYECGQAGHLGNDCPSRRPGKPMGTSTWSLPGKHNQTSNSPDGIMIKGRAQQQRAIEVVDSEDDDKANFYRPRIPAPARRGQIRIASQGLGQHRSSSGTPLSALYQGDHAGGYRDSEYLGGRRGEYSSAREQDQYNYRPSGRRSASPHPSARGPNRISGRYKPLPQEQPPRHGTYGGEPYRPMPSAAHSDYCDVYLTHDSMSVRKAHNSGRNHERNVLDYYQKIGHEKAQSVIDSITSSYAAEGQPGANPMLAPQGGGGPMGGQPFPPPPFGFPGGLPPPPFGMPGGPPNGGPGGFIPPPMPGRGIPFPPFPPTANPNAPIPNLPGGLPFPPPGFRMPPQGFPPPPQQQQQQGMSPPHQGPPFVPPGGMGAGGGFPASAGGAERR